MARTPGIISFRQAHDGEFAGYMNAHDENVNERELTTVEIGQEYEYYQLLGSASQVSCGCEGDDDCPIHNNLVKIQSSHALLAEPESTESCPNIGREVEDSWFIDPQLHLTGKGMGFLSQIAQLCYKSGLSSCQNPDCQTYYQTMERTAPRCGWTAFREWSITAMSCQLMMADLKGYGMHGRGHTHVARSVAGCCMILDECLENGLILEPLSYLDADEPDATIDLQSVVELIYWMAKIQYEKTIGPDQFGSWGTQLLPSAVSLPVLSAAMEKLDGLRICKTRFWNFASVGDRKEADIPDIVQVLETPDENDHPILAHSPPAGSQDEDKHRNCNPSKCQQSSISSTSKPQLHKCDDGDCGLIQIRTELLKEALERGDITACRLDGQGPCEPGQSYMAISHVWADGTGQGGHKHGEVNECLFNFWTTLASEMGCEGIWWDVTSVPSKEHKHAYNKALTNMHLNYEHAEFTLVHDRYLLNIPWSDDGLPCIALVLSTWFTRGWTALELARSKTVKVLFKDNTVKNLDDILAKSPAHASRAHWLATAWIKRLREPVNDIGDILGILSTRKTETLGDRPVIAGLLADVPGLDISLGEAGITKQILGYLGHVPQSCLLHGEATMADFGGFSWCAASLDDMPIPIPSSMESREASEEISMLDIDYTGAIEGLWLCRSIDSDPYTDPIQPFGSNLSSCVKVSVALGNRDKCLLLRPLSGNSEDKSLLVQPTKIDEKGRVLDCRYIGAVLSDVEPTTEEWHLINIRFGRHDDPENELLENALTQVHEEGQKICKYCLGEYGELNQDGQEDEDQGDENGAASPEGMTWLEQGIEYVSPKPVATLAEGNYEAASLEELRDAVKSGKHRAVHHIVSMLARDEEKLTKDDVDSTITKAQEDLGDDEVRLAKQVLWSLGDALVNHFKLEEAALAYEKALPEYPDKSFVGAAVTYNLGMVQAMLGNYPDARARFEEALDAFNKHDESKDLFKKRATRNDPRKKKQKQKKAKGSKQPAKSNAASQDDLEDWELAEEGWLSVWWNSAAALILLSPYDDSEWGDKFWMAFDYVLKMGEDNADSKEVFSKESNRDDQIDPETDKLLDNFYKAFRKFNFIFRRDHPLVFITARIIGVQLMGHAAWYKESGENAKARATWKSAKEHFERATAGLSGFGFLCFWEERTNSLNWWIADTDKWLQLAEEKLQH